MGKLKRQILRYVIGFHAEYTIFVNYLNIKETDKYDPTDFEYLSKKIKGG